ncbi:dipeptide/oligopeptide/nickel ABC transporter ATP-binding protein [Aliidongia dinghuensis]|uniref:Dipeptide/oligopeptide/nickel ABC transporter ATP-binding protein n=1 Tax=Aliidongia dinghuensis TaxID=1867774 RepID=A0A8J2YVN0_9PROT|nr:ATP-binding cassette domain-containing protein [Aliidongia dinghuensis]GGF28056.1 dipeptide/oligopeptide/nickel ABC transporter ATP-binding protein [Aliidongia dinghuensis]
MSAPILETRKLGMIYRGHREVAALSDVSFTLERGRALALVGESGSGKSTCAKLLTRMVAATDGQILFDGRDVTRPGDRREVLAYRCQVQMVFQDPFAALNPAHDVRHHLTRPLALHKPELGRAEREDRADELALAVGLDPVETLGKYPHELSGGQRQRVNLARAMAVEPAVLIADEPTSMLDVSIRLNVLDMLKPLKRERGVAMLYITHDIATARYVAEDTAVLFGGRIVEMGPTDAIIDAPHHPYTRLLLAAVPEVGRSFAAEDASLVRHADRIREISREPGPLNEVAPGHFVRDCADLPF